MSNHFTAETLIAMQRDLKRYKLRRVDICDDELIELHAIVSRKSITFHVKSRPGEDRAYLKLGTLDEMSIERARELTIKILDIAARGVDPVEDMRRKYIASL